MRSNTFTKTSTNNAERAGKLGEEIVAEKMGIELSEDKFDSKKDGMEGELSIEIKTLRLNHMSETVWIQKNQWNKIDGVDKFYWNEVPEDPEDYMVTYLVNNKNESVYYNNITKRGHHVRCYYKNKMTPVFATRDDRTVQIHDLSVGMSKWNRFK